MKAKQRRQHLAYQNWWGRSSGCFSRHLQVYNQTTEKGSPSPKKTYTLSEHYVPVLLRNTGVLNLTRSVFGSDGEDFPST